MTDWLTAVTVGLVLGFVVACVLLWRSADALGHARFEAWRAVEARRVGKHAVDAGRGDNKHRLGAELSTLLGPLPFAAADVRFLGHPAHYVVFDGHTDVSARRLDALRAVLFVSAGDEGTYLPDTALVEECISNGRVRWATLRPDQHG